jgi:hypothetical protein
MQTMRDIIKEAEGTSIYAVRRTVAMDRWLVADLGPDNPHAISSIGEKTT